MESNNTFVTIKKDFKHKLTIEDIITVDSDKCIGCNKCVKVCPVKEANKTKLVAGTEDKFITEVNPKKCINCGECVKACHHHARGYNDHIDAFLDLIQKGSGVDIIVAPAIKTAFPHDEWKHILQWFKDASPSVRIYDVSYGADICTWAYSEYIKHNKGARVISQPCPAIVNYIEKYQPKLLVKLAPVHSPASCLAIYMKKYLRVSNNRTIVLFSPCIAKTAEAIKYDTFNLNVTFKSIIKYFESQGIDFKNMGKSNFTFDSNPGILGQLFPRPGGLKDNLTALQPHLVIRTAEGPQHVYKRLERYAEIDDNRRPDVLDVLNCQYGCNEGTATSKNVLANVESYMDEIEIEAQKSRGWWLNKDKTYKQFDKQLDYQDFKCKYKNRYEMETAPSEKEIEEIFNSMSKTTPESRIIDCSSCGYETCNDMAHMIFKGLNVPNNCVYYMKTKLIQQLKELKELHTTIENELGVLNATSDTLTTTVDTIMNTSQKTSNTTTEIMTDLQSMSAVVKNFYEYFKDLSVEDVGQEDLDNVLALFEKLDGIFNESFLERLDSNINNESTTIEVITQLGTHTKTIKQLVTELKAKF